jgi:hypothetical protein
MVKAEDEAMSTCGSCSGPGSSDSLRSLVGTVVAAKARQQYQETAEALIQTTVQTKQDSVQISPEAMALLDASQQPQVPE